MNKSMKGKVMKNRYTLTLDVKETEELRKWLAVKGLSFSGYMNSLVHEQMDVIKDLGIQSDVENMTLDQFEGLVRKMAVTLKTEARAKKA